jgi:DNA-binding response OmpR family regulator
MNLLLVEDEIKVQQFLVEALRREGYLVTACSSYDETLAAITGQSMAVQLVIMDRMLGRSDSISIIPVLKAKYPACKILILSTLSTPQQKAAVLDMGADDYLGKPFELVELSARMRNLAKVISKAGQAKGDGVIDTHAMNRIGCGDIAIDLLEHRVKVDDRAVDLSNKEYHLLLTLARSPGRVFNKFQLLDQVWNTQFDIESNVVEVTIRNLRKKLESANSKVEIVSRRNVGYWLET